VARKVVVLDLHTFYDNRINKHIALVGQRYDVLRINVNLFHGRRVERTQGYKACIVDFTPTRGQYLNGLLFTLGTLIGTVPRRLHRRLREGFLQEGDEVLIHVHDPYLLSLAVRLSGRLPGSKVVYDRHDHFETWKNWLGVSVPGLFERLYGRRVEELIIANPGTEGLPKALSGKRVTQVPNYPLSKYFDWEAVERKAAALGQESVIELAYFGALSLGFDRDIDLMLRLMAALMREDPRITCTVAGRIFEQGVVGRLEEMKAEFGDRFRYLGELPYQEVIARSKEAHLGFFLMNPERPTWSPRRPYSANKIYEYLQTGTVPVVRAVIEEPEGVRDCSLFFDERSTFDEMLGSLRALCADRERLRRMVLQCFETGLKYSWEEVSPRYLECYDRVFAGVGAQGER